MFLFKVSSAKFRNAEFIRTFLLELPLVSHKEPPPTMKDQSVMRENTVASEICKFNLLQEQRVHTYRLFEEGHKIYLSTSPNYDFPTFRQLVHDVTQEFKRISVDIIAIEKNLRASGNAAVADTILAIQECEKKKLELTAHLQLARQMVTECSESELEKMKEKEIRAELGHVVEEINDHLTELRYEVYNGE
ncbi:required for excision 1-B domain-containing protein-like [Penaeus monodon]|uniref:required for excision 1-B domain-containing protein-like n=1 Tax=Penaeus monodon TaxID=6687 RepID=UPI0018A73685|nr:required for excision 1-B domain-containing protein-like [Penaeus monodon]